MNSLMLFAIIGLLAFIGLLWIFRKRKIVLLIIVAAAGTVGWYGYKEYYRTNKDLANVKPNIKISATDLIKEYEKNDSLANTKYLGRIIETSGNVKEIVKDDGGNYTIVLADSTSLSSVRCSMDTIHQKDAANILVGSSVTVRGKNNGYNKLVGSDVYLNYSVIVQQQK